MAGMFSKPKQPASSSGIGQLEFALPPPAPLSVSQLPPVPNLGQQQFPQMQPFQPMNPPKGSGNNDMLLQLLSQFRV